MNEESLQKAIGAVLAVILIVCIIMLGNRFIPVFLLALQFTASFIILAVVLYVFLERYPTKIKKD